MQLITIGLASAGILSVIAIAAVGFFASIEINNFGQRARKLQVPATSGQQA